MFGQSSKSIPKKRFFAPPVRRGKCPDGLMLPIALPFRLTRSVKQATMLAVETGARGTSGDSRMRDEPVTQDAVRGLRGERRLQARSHC